MPERSAWKKKKKKKRGERQNRRDKKWRRKFLGARPRDGTAKQKKLSHFKWRIRVQTARVITLSVVGEENSGGGSGLSSGKRRINKNRGSDPLVDLLNSSRGNVLPSNKKKKKTRFERRKKL